MIVDTPQGHVVKSESGKILSKPYSTKAAAKRRLKQIHFYKHKNK